MMGALQHRWTFQFHNFPVFTLGSALKMTTAYFSSLIPEEVEHSAMFIKLTPNKYLLS